MDEHDEGASHVVTFMVAAAIFIPAFTLMVVFTKDAVEVQPVSTAEMKSIARSSLDLLSDQPGRTPAGGTNWEADPEAASIVGLKEENGNALSAAKIKAASTGKLETDASNNLLDYPELKHKLKVNRSGIASTFEFHLRSYPIIPTTPENNWGSYVLPSGIKVAYIANYTSGDLDAAPLGNYNSYEDKHASVDLEAAALQALNIDFNGTEYRMPGGNLADYNEVVGPVVADRRDVLDPDGPLGGGANSPYFDSWVKTWLVDNPTFYDVLVVGSGVDQSIFAATNTVSPLNQPNWQYVLNWVNGGGTLIVLGSHDQDNTWLTCAGVTCIMTYTNGAQAGLTEPDLSNPILTTPNALRYTSYPRPYANQEWKLCGVETRGLAMFLGYNDAQTGEPSCTDNKFLHANMAATFAGRFDNGGRVVMTTYTPYAIGDPIEREKFFANLIVYAEIQELYLDVGPTIVENVPVSSAERVVTIRTESNALVDARLVFYVWGGGAR